MNSIKQIIGWLGWFSKKNWKKRKEFKDTFERDFEHARHAAMLNVRKNIKQPRITIQ